VCECVSVCVGGGREGVVVVSMRVRCEGECGSECM
jgi:hypothetical protein